MVHQQTDSPIVVHWLRQAPDGKPPSACFQYWKRHGYLIPISSSSVSVPYLKEDRHREGKQYTIGQTVQRLTASKFMDVGYRVHPFGASAIAVTYHNSYATIVCCQFAAQTSTAMRYAKLLKARQVLNLEQPTKWMEVSRLLESDWTPGQAERNTIEPITEKLREFIKFYDYVH